MSRKILVEILVDWEGYEDISDELLLADIAESIEVQ